MIEQIEGRNSKLKEELVTTKEQLNRTLLDKDCLDQELTEQGEALRKSEMLNTELGMLVVNKRRGGLILCRQRTF